MRRISHCWASAPALSSGHAPCSPAPSPATVRPMRPASESWPEWPNFCGGDVWAWRPRESFPVPDGDHGQPQPLLGYPDLCAVQQRRHAVQFTEGGSLGRINKLPVDLKGPDGRSMPWPEDLDVITLTPQDVGLKLIGMPMPVADWLTLYPLVRWMDRWGTRWEHC